MSAHTKIEWCDHTFNPWIGCTKVDALCAHCYAETRDKRHLVEPVDHWGPGAPRMRTSKENWRQPRRWAKMMGGLECAGCAKDQAPLTWAAWEALVAERGEPRCACGGLLVARRARVFCASMADWLDEEVPVEWLADLLQLIYETPTLDWLLLTKRPENFAQRVLMAGMFLMGYRDGDRIPAGGEPLGFAAATEAILESVLGWSKRETFPDNVWLGTSVGTQKGADERVPQLLSIPARVRFLSMEPLLEAVSLRWLRAFPENAPYVCTKPRPQPTNEYDGLRRIDWVICGGESGAKARPMHPEWARSLRDQCAAAEVPFFFKQWGEWVPFSQIPVGLPEEINLERYKVQSIGQHSHHRLGKHQAGRLLDGVVHGAFPVVAEEGGGR